MISKRSNTASAKGRDIAPGVPAQKGSVMEERVYRSQGYAMATFDQGRDADGAPIHEVWGFADEDSGSEGDGYLELRIHEIVETQKSGTLAVYYRQWFAPDGEPAFGMKPKRRVGSLASVKALINRRKMQPIDAKAIGSGDWIEWSGGPVPVEHSDAIGHLQFRGETRERAEAREPTTLNYWPWFGEDEKSLVIAYRVMSENPA